MIKNKNIFIGLSTGLVAFYFLVSMAAVEATSLPILINSPEAKSLLAPYEKLVRENPTEAERIKSLAIQQKLTRDFRKTDIQQYAAQIYRPEMAQLALIEYYREEQRQKKLEAAKPKPKQLEDLEPEQQLALNWAAKIDYDSHSFALTYATSKFPHFGDFDSFPEAALKEIEDSEWYTDGKEFNDWHGGKNVLAEAKKRGMKARLITRYGATVDVDVGNSMFQAVEAGEFNGNKARMSYLASLPTPVNNPSFQKWKRTRMPPLRSSDPKALEPLVREYRTILINPTPYFLTRGFATAWIGHQASGCGWVKGDYAPFATPHCDVNGNKLPFPGKKYDEDHRPPNL
ncbi:hypothetical protein [Nitrosospira briensis]|uniref:hypothetical protein n=1 Tax=Nitrosospira briensis TaxID=35799 RepID=UPI00046A4BD5|nr:hypothetical protein [Nitrosospira briensis]